MAEKFYQYPYAGTTEPSYNFIMENGVNNVDGSGKVIFYGSSNGVSSPIAVCCMIGSGYQALTVGSVFRIKSSNGNPLSMGTAIANNIYRNNGGTLTYFIAGEYEPFPNITSAVSAFIDTFNVEGYRNIKYNGTGCILIGDSFLPVGATAHAYITPNLGGSISESGITVKRAGADVPFTYANGIITFTVT